MRVITTIMAVFLSLGAFAQNSIGFSFGFEKNHLSNVNPNSLSPDGGSGEQSNQRSNASIVPTIFFNTHLRKEVTPKSTHKCNISPV